MKLVFTPLILFCLVFSQAGCSKLKKVEKAVDASARVAGQVETLLDNITAASDAGTLPTAKAVQMVRIIKDKVNPAVKLYAEFAATLPKGELPSKIDFAELQRLFKAVSAATAEVLVIYGTLTKDEAALIKFAVDSVIDTINLIRNGVAIGDDYFKEDRWLTLA